MRTPAFRDSRFRLLLSRFAASAGGRVAMLGVCLLGAMLALAACGDSSKGPGAGNTAGNGTANAGGMPNTGGLANGGDGNVGGAPVTAGIGGTGGVGGGSTSPFAYFVSQANGTTSATLENGVITVSSTFGASGNAFKYVAPNYYGTNSNGFIVLPTPTTGDFSIAAEVTVTAQTKSNNACGIGVGLTTGFAPTDAYAYTLMRNANSSTNGSYVSGPTSISAGGPTVPFMDGTPLALTLTRTGTQITFGAGPVGGPPTTQMVMASALTNGTTIYGTGAVYPAISFNNVAATISKLQIKDESGAVVFDSDSGTLVTYVPASLVLSSPTVSMKKGGTATVTATALAIGGAVAAVTATAADPTLVEVSVANGAANSTITLKGLEGGSTAVTVTNTSDTTAATSTKTLTVSVNDYPMSDPYGSLATAAYPAPGATAAYADGELALTFDGPPTLNSGGSIQIFKLSDGSAVDNIAFAGETQAFGSATINVGSQLVRVEGNTVYFQPHRGKLVAGTGYYVAIPTTAITGTLKTVAFNGLSDLNTAPSWSFTTRAAPTLDAANITVDGKQASTANFRTIQAALDAVSASLAAAPSVQINVAAGTYRELLRYSGTAGMAQTVRISGPNGNDRGDDCIVQWTNGNTMNGSTHTRASFYFTGANLVLENLTFKNTGVRSAVGQAETLYFAGGAAGTTLAAHNCSFSSNQDTLQTSGRNWFYDCHIEGNVDFVWGTADAALFESCDFRFINDAAGAAASYSLVVARTGTTIPAAGNGTVGKGYVLLDSTVEVDANVTAYFGRDAGTGAFYDQAALVNVNFTGAGSIGAGMWNVATAPLSLGDASYVGWKAAGCSGLNLASLTTAAGTSATIADQANEYDTRDHILNRVVTVTAGTPSGYAAAASTWNVSALASAWGAP